MKTIVKKILQQPNRIIPTNPLSQIGEQKSPPAKQTGIGFLQKPWWRIRRNTEPEVVYILSKRNYEVYGNIVMSTKNMSRIVAILDTGVGSSFIRQDELPQHMKDNIESLHQHIDIKTQV